MGRKRQKYVEMRSNLERVTEDEIVSRFSRNRGREGIREKGRNQGRKSGTGEDSRGENLTRGTQIHRQAFIVAEEEWEPSPG